MRKNKLVTGSILVLVLLLTLFCTHTLAQDIAFILPKSLRVSTNTVTIKGAVMNFDLDRIDIAVVNLIDLVREQKLKEKDKREKEPWLNTLEYETIPVLNGFFQTTVNIKEGINSVLAKPSDTKPTAKNIEMKVIVLDKVSPRINLIEPQSDRIRDFKKIYGKIEKKPYPRTIKITIEALVSYSTEDGQEYLLNKLLEATVPVQKKGFSLPVSLKELLTGEEILVITIFTDGAEVTKTLF
ncbi:MAG: hypothetical protein COY53_05760 [Elusimicrobia bacterium CG_4_10_14_0_8_um_filter_37_32]|nr:MAG: hypothetical protein COS17_06700 [Elusimicrobia bacterium CG02_land_8_20_14_3_00_37_13]PIZ13265.1 MAG: hypothetical protein COY53_05760 [Elusimicrobia bacterium CG_4_10_14_0_8_um_filter_37_32]